MKNKVIIYGNDYDLERIQFMQLNKKYQCINKNNKINSYTKEDIILS